MLELEHVSEHIVRIQLPLPLDGLPFVNCYAVLGSDEVTLIDPGWASAENDAALTQALRALGTEPAAIRRILVTHSHWDHYTQAIDMQRTYGAEVLLGRGEGHSIAAFEALEGAFPLQVDLLARAGATELSAEVGARAMESHELDMPFGEPDVWLDGGEAIDCGGRTIHAIATPGHTRGHMVFEDRQDGLLMTGDHILPRITPSIAFERDPDALSLRSYLGSLQLFLERPDGQMLPAHGAVDDSVAERAKELLAHHEERLDVIAALVGSGAESAYDVARQMTWTRRERSIDDLPTEHGMTAVLEVAAHLEFLVWQGQMVKDTADGIDRFATA